MAASSPSLESLCSLCYPLHAPRNFSLKLKPLTQLCRDYKKNHPDQLTHRITVQLNKLAKLESEQFVTSMPLSNLIIYMSTPINEIATSLDSTFEMSPKDLKLFHKHFLPMTKMMVAGVETIIQSLNNLCITKGVMERFVPPEKCKALLEQFMQSEAYSNKLGNIFIALFSEEEQKENEDIDERFLSLESHLFQLQEENRRLSEDKTCSITTLAIQTNLLFQQHQMLGKQHRKFLTEKHQQGDYWGECGLYKNEKHKFIQHRWLSSFLNFMTDEELKEISNFTKAEVNRTNLRFYRKRILDYLRTHNDLTLLKYEAAKKSEKTAAFDPSFSGGSRSFMAALVLGGVELFKQRIESVERKELVMEGQTLPYSQLSLLYSIFSFYRSIHTAAGLYSNLILVLPGKSVEEESNPIPLTARGTALFSLADELKKSSQNFSPIEEAPGLAILNMLKTYYKVLEEAKVKFDHLKLNQEFIDFLQSHQSSIDDFKMIFEITNAQKKCLAQFIPIPGFETKSTKAAALC